MAERDERREQLRREVAEEYAELRELALGTRNGPGAWVEYLGMRALMAVISRLPRRLQDGLVGGLARLCVRFEKRHNQAAREYIKQALGPLVEDPAELDRRLLQAWRHFIGTSIDDSALERHIPRDRILEHFEVEYGEGVRELIDSGRGAFLLSAHTGDFEAAAMVFSAIGIDELPIIKPAKNRPLSKHMRFLRESRGVRVLPRRGGLNLIPKLIESGSWVSLMVDQRPRRRFVMAPFFGREAPCERSATVMIKRQRVPLVSSACYRVPGNPFHYRLQLGPLIEPEQFDGLSVREVQTHINQELEALILRDPDQYLWLHDRYRRVLKVGEADEGVAQAE